MTYYVVHTGRRNRRFTSMADAVAFCSRVFSQTRIVLSIVQVTR